MLYTKKGDQGITSLYDGSRVPKNNDRIMMLSDMDDFISHFNECTQDKYLDIKTGLMDICTIIASPVDEYIFDEEKVLLRLIESEIDEKYKKLPKLQKFIISSSKYNTLRTKCRICEIKLFMFYLKYNIDKNVLSFMNRLSSLCFLKAYEEFLNDKSNYYYNSKFLTRRKRTIEHFTNENNKKYRYKFLSTLVLMFLIMFVYDILLNYDKWFKFAENENFI